MKIGVDSLTGGHYYTGLHHYRCWACDFTMTNIDSAGHYIRAGSHTMNCKENRAIMDEVRKTAWRFSYVGKPPWFLWTPGTRIVFVMVARSALNAEVARPITPEDPIFDNAQRQARLYLIERGYAGANEELILEEMYKVSP